MDINSKLKELGINLPEPITPIANYLSYNTVGNIVNISGQLPLVNGEIKHSGRAGKEQDLDSAQKAARICGINILAQLKAAANDDLNNVERCISITGFVSSTKDFHDHPKVINSCSDLLVGVFGENGKHARTAVGCSSLPLNATVEISAIFKLK